MDLCDRLRVDPGSGFRLARVGPDDTHGWTDKEAAADSHQRNVQRLAALSDVMWADDRFALLVVLQGMDTAGKDGTIREVFSGVNPQGCRVHGFKQPSHEELDHDFLWRIHGACPRRGEIGIFNRSHYEDVVAVRVNELVPRSVWSLRYEQINAFERILHENGTRIVKIFLHISKKEQKQRLLKRLTDPVKGWKMCPEDLETRKQWGACMRAYDDAIRRCSSTHAPWYVVPSDKKWFRNLAVSTILVHTLESLRLRIPPPKFDLSRLRIED
ncbi:Polyphosphate:AMP/ADP phosphotransferase [Phycisphaerales bacterium]|nr:Polyphosphate:AMP/ADP phosphotransferase [Phycisphaerales bacterium]